MKHKLLSFILLLSALVAGTGSVWAEDEVYKTALFGASYNDGNQDYKSSFDATNSGFVVTATNFNNNKNGWTSGGLGQIKCGRDGKASVATIITKSAIDRAITKVLVKIDAITTAKVNSIKLYTSSNGTTWTEAGTFKKATGNQSVALTSPAANLYYKVEFNCASGKDNGLVTISKVEYYKEKATGHDAVTGVSLNKTTALLMVGKNLTLTATVLPSTATDMTVTWSSSNEGVATVSSAGVVTAIALGTATITAKSNADETISAACVVTVSDGAIDLRTTGEITFGSWNQDMLGSSYGNRDCEIVGSDGNSYTWKEVNGYYNNDGWQIKASTGKVTSPTIKSNHGFTIRTTKKTNNVIISDGTNSETNSLTTTKTSTTITIQGNGTYAVFTGITITPLKTPISTDVTITDPGTLAKDATGTFAAISTDADDCTKTWTSSNSSVIEITNASTGAYTAVGRGTATITCTITPVDTENYGMVSAKRSVSVSAPIAVTANDVDMTYGDAAKAIGAAVSDGYAGTLTYESANTSVATVDASGEVTAVAVGSTTITITAPADAENLYTAGSPVVISVTVNAPSGLTEFPVGDAVQLYKRIETGGTGLPAGWTTDAGNLWHYDVNYGAVAGGKQTGNGVQDTNYDMVTEDFDLSGYCEPFVYFSHVGNKISSNKATVCKLFVQEGSETPVELTIPNWFGGTNWTFVNSGNIDLSDYAGKTVHFIFRYTPSGTNANGTWEVKDFTIKAYNIPSANVTLNKYGYATYCSVNPIDFRNTTGYTAWRVSDITSEGVITFTKITDKIKGGQGVVLYNKDADGVNTSDVTVTFDNGTTVFTPSDNKLVGTLAPTYVEDGTAYGLSGNKFVVNNGSGNISAGKAYIEALSIPTGVKDFTLVFEDETTGITETRTATREEIEAIFNLAGQRMSRMHKGVNIVNGKKILVK